MDVNGPQSSLIIVVSRNGYLFRNPISIIRLTPPSPSSSRLQFRHEQSGTSDIVAHIPRLRGYGWGFPLSPTTSPEDLYFFPDWSCRRPYYAHLYFSVGDGPSSLPGMKFNFSSKNCEIVPPPTYGSGFGDLFHATKAVTMGHRFFFLSSGGVYFSRYDTLLQKWKHLRTLPIWGPLCVKGSGSILGYAVLSDTILINFQGCQTRAYSVSRNKWYVVEDVGKLFSDIVGEAVVQNDIIYALRKHPLESLGAFTLNCRRQVKGDDDDLEFTCSLKEHYVVAGMGKMKFEGGDWPYRSLVRLGENNFCVVQTCKNPHSTIQNIQVTYLGVRETKWIVTNICLHKFEIPTDGYMLIRHCFSLPLNCKSNALKQGTRLTNLEAKAEIVDLPPHLCHIDECSEQTHTIIEAGQTSDHAYITDDEEEGHSICVMNLPPDFSFIKLKMEMKNFGPIKGIYAYPDSRPHMSEYWIVSVEFESAASKQNAIKAPRIILWA